METYVRVSGKIRTSLPINVMNSTSLSTSGIEENRDKPEGGVFMSDLTSVSLSDLVSALRERCATPQDIANVMTKQDAFAMSSEAGKDAIMTAVADSSSVAARDASAIRSESKESKYDLAREIDCARHAVERTINCQGQKAAECCCEIKQSILQSEAGITATTVSQFNAANLQAVNNFNLANLQAVSNFNALTTQGVASYNGLSQQICNLSREVEKGFAGVTVNAMQRDLDAKTAALVAAQNEISQAAQTQAIIAATRCRRHGGHHS